MRRIAVLFGAIFLGLSGTASAHEIQAGRALATGDGPLLMHPAPAPQAAEPAPVDPAVVGNVAFTLIGGPLDNIPAVEAAVAQESADLSRFWHTPIATFVPSGGLPIVLESAAQEQADCSVTEVACHWDQPGPRGIYVSTDGGQDATTEEISHEVLETLKDPAGTGREVVDEFQDIHFPIDGVYVEDFALPGEFTTPQQLPVEYLATVPDSGVYEQALPPQDGHVKRMSIRRRH